MSAKWLFIEWARDKRNVLIYMKSKKFKLRFLLWMKRFYIIIRLVDSLLSLLLMITFVIATDVTFDFYFFIWIWATKRVNEKCVLSKQAKRYFVTIYILY